MTETRFSTLEHWQLNQIPNTKEHDTVYIRKTFEFFFKDEPSQLAKKTLSRKGTSEQQNSLTSDEIGLVQQMFDRRIHMVRDYEERKKRFRRLVSSSLQTIRNQIKKPNI